MAKGSGSNRTSSPRTGGALKTEASKLGLSTSGLSMFQQAEAYGNMRNAPSSFVRSFMDKQA